MVTVPKLTVRVTGLNLGGRCVYTTPVTQILHSQERG